MQHKILRVVLIALGIVVLFVGAAGWGETVRDVTTALRFGGEAAAKASVAIMFDIGWMLIVGGIGWLLMSSLRRTIRLVIGAIFVAVWSIWGVASGFL